MNYRLYGHRGIDLPFCFLCQGDFCDTAAESANQFCYHWRCTVNSKNPAATPRIFPKGPRGQELANPSTIPAPIPKPHANHFLNTTLPRNFAVPPAPNG